MTLVPQKGFAVLEYIKGDPENDIDNMTVLHAVHNESPLKSSIGMEVLCFDGAKIKKYHGGKLFLIVHESHISATVYNKPREEADA